MHGITESKSSKPNNTHTQTQIFWSSTIICLTHCSHSVSLNIHIMNIKRRFCVMINAHVTECNWIEGRRQRPKHLRILNLCSRPLFISLTFFLSMCVQPHLAITRFMSTSLLILRLVLFDQNRIFITFIYFRVWVCLCGEFFHRGCVYNCLGSVNICTCSEFDHSQASKYFRKMNNDFAFYWE